MRSIGWLALILFLFLYGIFALTNLTTVFAEEAVLGVMALIVAVAMGWGSWSSNPPG